MVSVSWIAGEMTHAWSMLLAPLQSRPRTGRKGSEKLDPLGPKACELVGSLAPTGIAAARVDSAGLHAYVWPGLQREVHAVRRLRPGANDGHGYVDGHARGYADECAGAGSGRWRVGFPYARHALPSKPQPLLLWCEPPARITGGVDGSAGVGSAAGSGADSSPTSRTF
jgi:hypothetical protein